MELPASRLKHRATLFYATFLLASSRLLWLTLLLVGENSAVLTALWISWFHRLRSSTIRLAQMS